MSSGNSTASSSVIIPSMDWGTLDPTRLAAIAHNGPPPVFATVSGAHLYGFASPDSDVDLRGAFLHPSAAMLGLHPPNETITVMENSDIELDWVAHDLRKFARLLTQHNGYVLEQLFSPLVVIGGPALDELRALGRGCITRPTVRHYRGFAKGRRRRLGEPDPTVKHLLYAYRVYLSGIHLMRSGEVVAHLPTLLTVVPTPGVEALIERKQAGAEHMALADGELEHHQARLDALDGQLSDAFDASTLPLEPTTVDELDAFVVRLRLERA